MSEVPSEIGFGVQPGRILLVGRCAFVVVALVFGVNVLGVLFESWELDTYMRLACAWLVFFLLGIGLLISQIGARHLHWSLVLLAQFLAAVAVWINMDMAARISASV